MDARIKIQRPADVALSLEVVATLSQFEDVREALIESLQKAGNYNVRQFARVLTDVVAKGKSEFRAVSEHEQ